MAHGLRLPIEVVEIAGEGVYKYGLVSGWRRFTTFKMLHAEGRDGFEKLLAFVRDLLSTQSAYAAMVEENEIREDLSPYERGRVVQRAVGAGAFSDLDGAVSTLFSSASKAKRSKIRSFALVFKELGDVLTFGSEHSERSGLELALALKDGQGAKIREVLASGAPVDFAAEMKLIKSAIAAKVSRA